VNALPYFATLTLGAGFLVAGGSKLAAGREWPVQARGLGAPEWSIKPLPWIEMSVGALLMTLMFFPIPTVLALGMLLVFTCLVVKRLTEGKHPPCACFGSWSAKPLGPRQVARNGAFIALALVSLFG